MSDLVLAGNTSGSVTIAVPDVAGTTTLSLQANTGTIALTSDIPTVYALTSGTAVASTSGTSIDFTGIPSWVKRITVMLNGVSTTGTNNLLVQIGDSGGVETTGYIASANYSTGASAASDAGFFVLYGIPSAAVTFQGCLIFCNLDGNTWVMNGNLTDNQQRNSSSAGGKTLSATLDRVRITTTTGTDTFDAGTINIMYE